MTRHRWWRWILIGAAVVLLIGWMMRSPPVPVDLAEVSRGPVVVTVSEEGVTRVRQRYVVAAPITGRLERPLVEAGDSVAEGAANATMGAPPLDPRVRSEAEAHYQAAIDAERTARATAAQATDALKQAEREERRVEVLHRQGVVAQEAWERTGLQTAARRRDVEAAAARAEAAHHDTEQARAAVQSIGSGRVLLRSPVAGRVLSVIETNERVLPAGSPVAEIGDPTRLEIGIDLLSTDAVLVEPGDTMRVTGWGGTDTLVALVRRVAPSGFTRTSALGVEEQRVPVTGDLVAVPGRLGDRFRVDVTIPVGRVGDAVRVSRSALFRERGVWRVFVVASGRAAGRTVDVGMIGGDVVEIRTGLEPGDRVILHPDERIRDGQRVTPRPDR